MHRKEDKGEKTWLLPLHWDRGWVDDTRSLTWHERPGRKVLAHQTIRDSKQIMILEGTLENICADPCLTLELTSQPRGRGESSRALHSL